MSPGPTSDMKEAERKAVRPLEVVLGLIWIVISLAQPLLLIDILSPALDRLVARGIVSVTAVRLLFWAFWIPFNALAWWFMLPGRGFLYRGRTSAMRKVLRWVGIAVIVIYWCLVLFGRMWLIELRHS
jgi:quinol-cytochrome oxidoreductase complex cytochrome b subunit